MKTDQSRLGPEVSRPSRPAFPFDIQIKPPEAPEAPALPPGDESDRFIPPPPVAWPRIFPGL